MLEHIFGSRTRVKLLGLFLRHPNEAMFVREITRRINTQINAVRRELANLVSFGLITEDVRPAAAESPAKKQPGLKRRYYQINAKFPLLLEITALFTKAQLMLEKRMDREILKLGDIRYLAFLGRFLGKAAAPVDLFVVGNVQQPALKRLVAEMEKDLSSEINYSLMTPEEFIYRKDITDKFLYAILEAPKNVVVDKLNEKMK